MTTAVKNRLQLAEPKSNGPAPAAEPVRMEREEIKITPLRQAIISIPIIGESPLMVLRFSKKKQDQIRLKHEAGDQAKTKRKREAKDFHAEYEEAKYRARDAKGKEWLGLNATGIRNGMIETCRMAGFVMTKAKMSIFVIADGYDIDDMTPLVKIDGKPEMNVSPVRNASGVIDLRPRCMFKEWKMTIHIRFDEDQFSPADIINLMMRVGQQNGLGEGRPNGREGNGMGMGLFVVDADHCTLVRLGAKPDK